MSERSAADSIGKIIDSPMQRDAIHVAVAPVVAGEALAAGTHVGLLPDGTARCAQGLSSLARTPIGIVDPFLSAIVMPGETFWLFLYPGSITSLRHDWTHAAFEAPPSGKAETEAWLRKYADLAGLSLDRLLWGAEDRLSGGYGPNTETDIPNECYGEDNQTLREFWRHWEIYTGQQLTTEQREDLSLPFHCSC